MKLDIIGFLAVLGIIVGIFFGKDIAHAMTKQNSGYGSAYSKEQIAEFEERKRKWREEYEAANPEGPPISEQEHADFKAWLDAQKLPAVRLAPDSGGAITADGSRLGGPVALAEGQAWPVSKRGNKMEFLAQLDFATLPPLEGFPADGVLQFFILQDDDLWGIDVDNPQASDVAVLYRPNSAGTEPMTPNPPVKPEESNSPFWPHETRTNGVALNGTAFTDTMPYNHWMLDAKQDGNVRRPGFDQWEALLESRETGKTLVHQAGGYPVFVQWDFRKPDKLDDYDTVLLRLTSDDFLMWGDVGEANFLIRSEDLAKRDFSKVIFWWDCS